MPDGTDYKKLDTHDSWDDTDRKITQMGYLGWRPRFLEVKFIPFLSYGKLMNYPISQIL